LQNYQGDNLAALIGVFCFNGDCDYELKVDLGDMQILSEGEIIYDEVK